MVTQFALYVTDDEADPQIFTPRQCLVEQDTLFWSPVFSLGFLLTLVSIAYAVFVPNPNAD